MRLPIEALEPQLPGILQGLLLWSGDSKNKFKLKVGGIHSCHVNILLICFCCSLPWKCQATSMHCITACVLHMHCITACVLHMHCIDGQCWEISVLQGSGKKQIQALSLTFEGNKKGLREI